MAAPAFAADPRIPGLHLVPDVITAEQEAALLAHIHAAPWDTRMKRRVQHYGHEYVYHRVATRTQPIPPPPAWAVELFETVRGAGLPIPAVPYNRLQIIVNEYQPGQGTSAHVDDPRTFGPWVLSVSLGSQVIVDFQKGVAPPYDATSEKLVIAVVVPARSAYLMTGDARYNWTHAIAARKTDRIGGVVVPRGRRISVTFRAMA